MKYYYEGIGLYLDNITKASLGLRTITYTGEKKSTMWWIEFERRICLAYQTYVKHEGREFHSDQMKLRTFLEKVTCDWLGQIKSSIKVRLYDRPMTYTFAQALHAFKTEVNIKYPPGAIKTIRVKELSKGRGGHGRGRYSGRYAVRGIFGRIRGGRGYGGGSYSEPGSSYSRPGSKVVTLKNGKKIDYHASIKFYNDVYNNMTDDQRDTLHRERK